MPHNVIFWVLILAKFETKEQHNVPHKTHMNLSLTEKNRNKRIKPYRPNFVLTFLSYMWTRICLENQSGTLVYVSMAVSLQTVHFKH